MAEPAGDAHLVVATVRRPHGVRGELLVAVETDRPRAVFRPGRILRWGDASGRPVGGEATIEKARPMQGGFLLKLAEHTGRTAEVEALRGRSLLIPVADAAPAEEGEVHYHELVGMSVFAASGEVGSVREVMETAGGEILVVVRPGRSDVLVPFAAEFIAGVDREARRIDVTPPEGLLDL